MSKTFSERHASFFADTPARKCLDMLFDKDSFAELDPFVAVDASPCGVVCGYGAVQGAAVCAFAQDGAGVGKAQAAKIVKLYDWALKTGTPVVGIYNSKGARLTEGAGALAAYGELILRSNNLSGVVPQISLITGDCVGSMAMLACSADFVVMTKDASFYMTPPGLSKGQDKADGAGTAEGAAISGVAHIVESNVKNSCQTVRRMLGMMPLNNLAALPVLEFSEPLAKLPGAPYQDATSEAVAAAICDNGSLTELLNKFGSSAYTALATISGQPVGVAAAKNKLDADSCAKIAKLVSVCDSFQIPVLTFVDTTGFEASAKAEICGAVREMAKLAHVYAEATTPKVAVITSRACGSAYVALAGRAAGADYTIAWPGAIISPLEPQTSVEILYGDRISPECTREDLLREYIQGEASAFAAAENGYIDDVIAPEKTRPALVSALELLAAKRVSRNPKKHGNMPM